MLIVIEGLDASGKETQTNLLYENLKNKYEKVIKISFPNYESPSSSLVKMYLNGDFGKTAAEVSPYIASTFFAADRYASFKKEWETYYKEGYLIILDRYVTANMLHQASKIDDMEEKERFIRWLEDFEYGLYGLPRPDISFFLNVPPEVSRKLMENRANKITNETKKDIHESDMDYLKKTFDNALYITKRYGFIPINCTDETGSLRSIESIQQELLAHIKI